VGQPKAIWHSEAAIAAKHAGQFVRPSVNLKSFYIPGRWSRCSPNPKYSYLLAMGEGNLFGF